MGWDRPPSTQQAATTVDAQAFPGGVGRVGNCPRNTGVPNVTAVKDSLLCPTQESH